MFFHFDIKFYYYFCIRITDKVTVNVDKMNNKLIVNKLNTYYA
jgi:hypothetical protein